MSETLPKRKTIDISAIDTTQKALQPYKNNKIRDCADVLRCLAQAPDIVLHDAAGVKSREMIQVALDNGASIDALDRGVSVFGKAASANAEFFEFLLSLGAKNCTDFDLKLICECNNFEALDMLTKADARCLPTDGSLIEWALAVQEDHRSIAYYQTVTLYSPRRFLLLKRLVALGAARPSDAGASQVLISTLESYTDSRFLDQSLELGKLAISMVAHGFTTLAFANLGFPIIDETSIVPFLKRRKPEAMYTVEFSGALKYIERERILMILQDVCALSFALCSILPTLVLIEILDQLSWKAAYAVPYHMKWNLVKTIKHGKE